MQKPKGTYDVYGEYGKKVTSLLKILETLREFKLEPKRIRFIHSDNNNSSLFLLDSVYYGREGLKVETPIFLERE